MHPLKTNVQGPALWQDNNQSRDYLYQDEALQDFLNIPSDMESFMALETIEEVTEKEELSGVLPDLLQEVGIPQEMDSDEDYSLQSNQTLIDEVESYLQLVSGSPTVVEEDESSSFEANWNLQNDNSMEMVSSAGAEADRIFDALTSGNVLRQEEKEEVDGKVNLSEADLQNAFTTSVVDSNGEKVIIIITSPPAVENPRRRESTESLPTAPPPALSPAPSVASSISVPSPGGSSSGVSSYGSDCEWSPSPSDSRLSPAPGKQRKKYQRRSPPKPPAAAPYPKEKTERKKAQNRTAAFKYREKKKAEQEAVDDELDHLIDRNAKLKEKMSVMEIELKVLKNLMIQSGLEMYIK